jgi:acyl carrier protein
LKVNSRELGRAIVDPELHQKVVAIFADIFQVEIESDVEDIHRDEIEAWDSVNHLRLVVEIEEVFETSLSDEEVTTIASLRDVEKLLIDRGTGIGLRELTCSDEQ